LDFYLMRNVAHVTNFCTICRRAA